MPTSRYSVKYSLAIKIGALIKHERNKAGINQKQLAAIAGITQESVYRLEKGGNVGLGIVGKICDALELTLDVLRVE